MKELLILCSLAAAAIGLSIALGVTSEYRRTAELDAQIEEANKWKEFGDWQWSKTESTPEK